LPSGVAHQSYAPDLASEGTKTGADFEVKLLQQLLANSSLVNALGHFHKV
jgi:hypothetical protein